MKAALYPEAERVSVTGPDAFYAYCAMTVYGNLSVAAKVKTELWDYFDSDDSNQWPADIDSTEYRKTVPAQFPPLDILVALAVQLYSLKIRIYSARYANGHRDHEHTTVAGRSMTLELGDKGELYLLVTHDARTGKNKIPATIINVLAPSSTTTTSSATNQDSESPFSLAVYDSHSRTHMKMGARFIPPSSKSGKTHYMNFDLDLSTVKPSWQFILKGCDAHPVFIFAMRTEAGVRHASYIAHWPVAMVEPYITLSKRRGDDGLIVVPVQSNSLDEARRAVVSELKCVIDA